MPQLIVGAGLHPFGRRGADLVRRAMRRPGAEGDAAEAIEPGRRQPLSHRTFRGFHFGGKAWHYRRTVSNRRVESWRKPASFSIAALLDPRGAASGASPSTAPRS